MNKTMIGAAALALMALGAAAALLALGLAPIWARALLAGSLMILIALTARGRARRAPAKAQGLTFRPEAATSAVTFSDVAANDVARESLESLCEYLKNPEKYQKLGARMPRGVLLYGPPGTGKTLLARALAGEAGVPFFALSGSDFVQMYAGVGASRVRELFAKARAAGKCVIFIDEIDALGRRRDDSASDERDQTLNALLSEMSGFRPAQGTLVLAATNRIDTLDPALTRPGRFDRLIEVGLPGRAERKQILALHVKDKPVSDTVDLTELAARTAAFSGASLEALVNEAAILAANRGGDEISPADVDRAYLDTVAGVDRPAAANRKELAAVALHEAGHALTTRLLCPERVITRVSILPTSKGAAGYSLSVPGESLVNGREDLNHQLEILLAGRAAELLVGGAESVTGGAANDLAKATELACAMALDLGLADCPYLSYRQLQKSTGSLPPEGARLAQTLLEERFTAVSELLKAHLDALMRLTDALLTQEALSGAELDAVLPY